MNIAHISDIHIRSTSRYEEYRDVFNRLKESLVINKPDFIVITGDVYHNKLNLSPEAFLIIYDFFRPLAEIAEIILIPGNHDANLTNKDRLDVLTPFIDEINSEPHKYKIHYLKHTGHVIVKDVAFISESVLDDVKLDEFYCKKIESKYKVALLHGTYEGSTDETGYKLSGEPLPLWVQDVDWVLLGDIHKRQTLKYKEFHE